MTPPGPPSEPGPNPPSESPSPARLPSAYGPQPPLDADFRWPANYAQWQAARPSKAMAGWSLGLAIVSCWGIGLVLSLIFAIIVLRRGADDGRDHGKGLAIAALVIDGLWTIAFIGLFAFGLADAFDDPEVDRDGSGQVTDSTEASVLKLRVGDCLNDAALIGAGDDAIVTDTVQLIPCERGHDLEVYKVFGLPGDAYPGDDAVEQAAGLGCAKAFHGFVGKAYGRSDLEFFSYYPQERGWDLLDDHDVTCVVGDLARRTYGSLKGSKR